MSDATDPLEIAGIFGAALACLLLVGWASTIIIPAAGAPEQYVATVMLLGLALVGVGMILLVGAAHVSEHTRGDTESEEGSAPGEMSGAELVAEMREYPRVGEYLLTRINRVYAPTVIDEIDIGEGSHVHVSYPNEETKVAVEVDIPTGTETWTWELPLSWTEDESPFVSLAHNYGLSRSNFDELEGEPILVDFTDGVQTLQLSHPEQKIADWLEDGDLEWEEIEMGAIQEQFDLDIEIDEGEIAGTSGIYVEELPDEFIPKGE